MTQYEETTKSILIADVAGFSDMRQDVYIAAFSEHVLNPVLRIVEDYNNRVTGINTWGDAIFALFESPVDCCVCSLRIRDHFRREFKYEGIPYSLGIRVAVHQGLVCSLKDSSPKVGANFGHEIILAARIEPVVKPGTILATEQMKTSYVSTERQTIEFDSIGKVQLAKGYGERELFVVRNADEKPADIAAYLGTVKETQSEFAYDISIANGKLGLAYNKLVSQIDDKKIRLQIDEMYHIACSVLNRP